MKNTTTNSGRESSLHSAIKKWYSLEGDKFEAKVDDFKVDILRGDLLIEIQTANFSAIKPKLLRLLNNHKVRLVYPIPRVKWIIHQSMTRETLGRRKSPRKGDLLDLFSELIRIPDLFANDNLSLEVLITEMEEIWCNDGRGSWRRKGASVQDRKLIRVVESKTFKNKTDFQRLLPQDLAEPFSNRNLAESLGITLNQSRKMTYTLKKMGAITHVGEEKRQMLFARAQL